MAALKLKEIKAKAKVDMELARREQMNAAYKSKTKIINEKRSGQAKRDEFIKYRNQAARADVDEKGQDLQKEIQNYEKEAKELEMLEAQLLLKLQETQQNERTAFQKLESAMIDASMPK